MERSTTANPSRLALTLVVIAMALILGLGAERPVVIWTTARYDDMLFITQAHNLLTMQWLGPYSDVTLVKGPMTPIFIALAHLTGLSFSMAQTATLLLAVFAFSWTAARLLRRAWLFPVLSLSLIFLPSLHSVASARVMRETLFTALTFFLVAALAGAAIPGQTTRQAWKWGILAGLAFGALWLTREEGITLVPIVAVFALAGLMRLRASWAQHGRDWALVKSVGAAALVATALIGSIGLVNATIYGRFIVNEMKDADFQRAMTAVQRASYPHWQPYLPVSRAARFKIYRESPTFLRLKPFLDPENGRSSFYNPGCSLPDYQNTCGDIAGGWWMWALRSAVAQVGAHQDPTTARNFYAAIAKEVEAACVAGRLTCAAWLPPLVPPMTHEQADDLPARIIEALDVFALALPVQFDVPPSVIAPERREAVLTLLNFPRFIEGPSGPSYVLRGWFWRPGGGWFDLREAEGGALQSSERLPSPDIAAYMKDPGAQKQRFEIRYACPDAATCPVILAQDNRDGGSITFDLATLRPGGVQLGDGQLYFDAVEALEGRPTTIRTAAYHGLISGLGGLTPVYRALCLLGPVAFLIALVRHRGAWIREPALLLATALLAGVVARAVVLALVDLTSFPALHSYLYPASGPPMLVAFSILSMTAVFTRTASPERPVETHLAATVVAATQLLRRLSDSLRIRPGRRAALPASPPRNERLTPRGRLGSGCR
ncbi:MAG TPA: hypothetical protein VGN97_01080 [Mesorhizobium sp.]|nr:hypothetical protein [Mesorhizobium sp.]